MLSNYIHIGSLKEYYELRYWKIISILKNENYTIN